MYHFVSEKEKVTRVERVNYQMLKIMILMTYVIGLGCGFSFKYSAFFYTDLILVP